jgi:cellulose synthase/poly-beta-1,6-N-acetylglucosamine synthase-like glycosyltransferase
MNVDVLDPALTITVLVAGAALGWRASRASDGEVAAQTKGFSLIRERWFRIYLQAFAMAMALILLDLLAEHFSLSSRALSRARA